MKYYRDVDYFLYFEEFPHMGVPGTIVANIDGTVNIYINTLYCVEKREEAIRHELYEKFSPKTQSESYILSASSSFSEIDKASLNRCCFTICCLRTTKPFLLKSPPATKRRCHLLHQDPDRF